MLNDGFTGNPYTDKTIKIVTPIKSPQKLRHMENKLIRRPEKYPHIEWEAPDLTQLQVITPIHHQKTEFRLFHIQEISEGPPGAYRLAMANVLSSLCDTGCAIVYVLAGRPEGVSLYIGVSSNGSGADLHEAARTLDASFAGNFLGARLKGLKNHEADVLLTDNAHFGLITGIPTLNDNEENTDNVEFQGIERLVNSLVGDTWQLVVVSDPASDKEIGNTLENIYDLSTALSEHIKHSVQRGENSSRQTSLSYGSSRSESTGTSVSNTVGASTTNTQGTSEGQSKGESSSTGKKSWNENASSSSSLAKGSSDSKTEGTSDNKTQGTSESRTEGETLGDSLALTSERIDKRAERLQKHLSEDLIERFLRGRSKGMFRTAIYVSANFKATFDRLSRGVLSIYQGNQSSITPLRITPLKESIDSLGDLLRIRHLRGNSVANLLQSALAHSTPIIAHDTLAGATWLNTTELALLTGLPSQELPGIKIRKSVDFAVNTRQPEEPTICVHLGKVIQHGRILEHKQVDLPLAELNKHVFITGVTGAGKTTTCMTLLLESTLPFLVIEPAKTEYRALHGKGHDVEYYTLGREDLTPFRLNPFQLLRGQKNLAGHIATLNATMAAVFPMEAAMPHIVEEAIINAYKAKGWDIHSTENYITDDPWANDSEVWPIFSDMIGELDAVIKSKGMGQEFEEKYRGSLVARLTNLTLGTKGRMLNTRHSLDFSRLVDKKVVIELEEIKNEEDKALFMGLILYRLAECMKQRHRIDKDFQHLTLVEEAHRLLSRPEPGDPGAKKMGVEMFANLLAEVRKYGEGLIIADQIPNKLVSDVIKNTNTKIVHRLFAADDRNAIGDSMGLSDEQKDFLPLLQLGETIIYCGGWHAPVRVQIRKEADTNEAEISEEEIRLQGQRQLWEQRHSLLPHLAAHPAMDNPKVLADFLHDGGRMLNMLIKLNYTRLQQNSNLIKKEREKLLLKLANRINQWAANQALSMEKIGQLLAGTMSDCEATMELRHETLALLLPQACIKVTQSLDSFDTWASTERDAKKIFHDGFFKNLDSI